MYERNKSAPRLSHLTLLRWLETYPLEERLNQNRKISTHSLVANEQVIKHDSKTATVIGLQQHIGACVCVCVRKKDECDSYCLRPKTRRRRRRRRCRCPAVIHLLFLRPIIIIESAALFTFFTYNNVRLLNVMKIQFDYFIVLLVTFLQTIWDLNLLLEKLLHKVSAIFLHWRLRQFYKCPFLCEIKNRPSYWCTQHPSTVYLDVNFHIGGVKK